MNYARFRDVLRAFGHELSELGVPNDTIDDILLYAETSGIPSALKSAQINQYVLEYKRVGVAVMSERYKISRQAARKRFNQAIAKPNCMPPVVCPVT